MQPISPPAWQPRSLQQLVLIGFLLVVTPLCVLIYQATQSLTDQSDRIRDYAQQALDSTKRAEQMNQLAEDLLRASRQFQIVQQDEIQQRLDNLAGLYRTELDIQSFWLNDNRQVATLHQQLNSLQQQPADSEPAQQLLQATRQLNDTLRQRLEQRLTELNLQAADTQRQVWMLTIGLIALSGLLILLMSRSISRPVRELARRIRALGQGERQPFHPGSGPHELQTLHGELNWLSEQLDQLEHEKQRFLRHMSHELKTPLTTLREGSDLLADGVTGDLNADQQEVVELLQHQARELQTLIEQLLDYNRLQVQSPALAAEPIELLPLLRDALAPYRLQLQQKRIDLQLPEREVQWPVDRTMLLRVLGNLISNATLYGSPDGWLAIELTAEPRRLLIDISNRGPTIPEEDVSRLFEPFYQGQNRRSGPVKGSGIGLSIAQDATRALNGELSLHQNQNQIVTFRLSLPRPESS
ncbi:HAMP domain-containing sensor histidine kinase [Marinobacterium arenosum]|uniref:HAMP domain-containing sensor histidine kinase n=1 Tax=Marinobacterium arenosum TaxID=2862496 RepID=UPI001C94797B|nr:ATP-binding protein [Marinobacterium arenosum]MBY4678500.1 two-component sensor histidine kinase [Marinobacterium arenosum]